MLLRLLKLAILALLSGANFAAVADPKIQYSGFLTAGLSYHDGAPLQFHRSFSVKPQDHSLSLLGDSLIGLQIDSRLNSEWDLVMQGLLKDRVDNSVTKSLEWAFIRYQPNREWQWRLGRTNTDLFALSEYANVGYAYLWARPPVEFYAPAASISRLDGIDVQYSTTIADGYWQSRLMFGQTNADIYSSSPVKVYLRDILSLSNNWQNEQWSIRFVLASARLHNVDWGTGELATALTTPPLSLWSTTQQMYDDLVANNNHIRYLSAGLKFEAAPWLWQSEISATHSNWLFIPNSIAAYSSLGYQINALSYYGYISDIHASEAAKQYQQSVPSYFPYPLQVALTEVQNAFNQAIYGPRINQTTFALGVRYDWQPNLAVKLQLDHIWQKGWQNAIWSSSEWTTEDTQHNLLSVTVEWVF